MAVFTDFEPSEDPPLPLSVLGAIKGAVVTLLRPGNLALCVLVYLPGTLIASCTLGLAFVQCFGSVFSLGLSYDGSDSLYLNLNRVPKVWWTFNVSQCLLSLYIVCWMVVAESTSLYTFFLSFPFIMTPHHYVVHLSVFHGMGPLDTIRESVSLVRKHGFFRHFLLWLIGEYVAILALSLVLLPMGLFMAASAMVIVVVPVFTMALNETYCQVFDSISVPPLDHF